MALTSTPLQGRAVLITGPAKGMGPAICRSIAEAGGDLILAARDQGALQALAADLAPLGRRILVRQADVTQEEEVAAAAAAAAREFGPALWGAVTVAGVTGPAGRKLWEHTLADYHDVFGVNVLGTFLVLKAVLPRLVAQGRGSIVTIGGTFGFKGVRDHALYGASKWTLRGLTKSAALEAGASGVRVNMVSPGGVEGPRLTRQLGEDAAARGIPYEERYRQFAATAALQRMSTAEDVAAAVLFLLTDASRNVTGQDLLVDGGTIV